MMMLRSPASDLVSRNQNQEIVRGNVILGQKEWIVGKYGHTAQQIVLNVLEGEVFLSKGIVDGAGSAGARDY